LKRIKVLVVEDSIFMRNVISDIINSDPQLQVIGTARDGEEALNKLVLCNYRISFCAVPVLVNVLLWI